MILPHPQTLLVALQRGAGMCLQGIWGSAG